MFIFEVLASDAGDDGIRVKRNFYQELKPLMNDLDWDTGSRDRILLSMFSHDRVTPWLEPGPVFSLQTTK